MAEGGAGVRVGREQRLDQVAERGAEVLGRNGLVFSLLFRVRWFMCVGGGPLFNVRCCGVFMYV